MDVQLRVLVCKFVSCPGGFFPGNFFKSSLCEPEMGSPFGRLTEFQNETFSSIAHTRGRIEMERVLVLSGDVIAAHKMIYCSTN